MTTRTVAHIETSTNEMVGPFKIKNVLPTRNLKQVDPFLLIHHMQPFVLQPGEEARIPPHPHAGFEVVTYLIEGEFFHRDSKGHDVIGKEGDLNWMSSSSGIVHSEGPSADFLKNGGKLELMQIWINLPASQKSADASFHNYPSAAFPVIENAASWMKILVGNHAGQSSPVITQSPMFGFHIKVKKGELFTLPVDPAYSSALYIMKGKARILNEEVQSGQLVNFNTDGDQLVFVAKEDTEVFAFGGLPLKEKVVSYGPFVMNSFEEIQQSIAAYESGKMGELGF